MRLQCVSDIHGNVDAVREMIRDSWARKTGYDGVIFAGDLTNYSYTRDLDGARSHLEEMLSELSEAYDNVFYILGNRDKGILKGYEPPDTGVLLKRGEAVNAGESIKVTAYRSLVDGETILVEHNNELTLEKSPGKGKWHDVSENALMHVAGYTHQALVVRNYLNTGFLYRDASRGATPIMGCYFTVEQGIEGIKRIECHRLGPVNEFELMTEIGLCECYTPYDRCYRKHFILR